MVYIPSLEDPTLTLLECLLHFNDYFERRRPRIVEGQRRRMLMSPPPPPRVTEDGEADVIQPRVPEPPPFHVEHLPTRRF
jgi:hypothetical protein